MSVRKTLWTVVLAVMVAMVPGAAHAQTSDEPVKVRCGSTDTFWGLLICAATCSEALDKDTVTLQECKRIDGEVR
ncbi:hypothetical protein [Nocardiopsis sp. FIRDI 009]|uniref:hypothetical protein n=1 Tax=Nocardiopsis sp. FIRDI 009 TaxID=714197 RepID=UPI000E229E1A|nr:hypothetical protein [Nocardiopsis sp. FIRDI 009]